jgi:oligopeptidase A
MTTPNSSLNPQINPLLNTTTSLPAFNAIRPEHIAPAIDTLLQAADAALEQATSTAVVPEYDALSAVLDVATEKLTRAWGAVSHLKEVLDSAELRDAYNAQLPKVVEFQTRLGADERLYTKYKAVAAQATGLSAPRQQALAHTLRDFKLSGAELQGAAKKRYAELQDLQAELSQKFSEHVMDATDAWSYLATATEVMGVPPDIQQAALHAAQQADEPVDGQASERYKLTLHLPCYIPVMQYAQDRALRENLYRAYTTRASEWGPPELDNTALISELLTLRQEEAKLLGLPNPATQSLVAKMASSPEQVIAFLENLGRQARPGAERDLHELQDFARTEPGLAELQAWDMAYAAQKLKEQRYAYSEQEVKQYFTEPKVLQGLFHIIETVFEVRICPDTAAVWHDSVRFFRIERPAAADGSSTLVGQFYLDLYARPGKSPGAWMDDVRNRWLRPEGQLQTPVAHLVCNFASPMVVNGVTRPALLTHDDVVTLFHEFGHGLQHMLTQIDDLGVSGISGVEWDAVELPSQFMENFCWEWDVVKHLTAHVDTGEPLPRALFDRMLAAKNFHSGLALLRQVEFSLIDMHLHTLEDTAFPLTPERVAHVQKQVRAQVAVLTPPSFSRTLHTFSHIFSGGYSAGYYSYLWAEVLSADAWSAFEEASTRGEPVLHVETGRRLRQHIFESGGSRSAMESFKAFRGREPQIDALLRHQGLV